MDKKQLVLKMNGSGPLFLDKAEIDDTIERIKKEFEEGSVVVLPQWLSFETMINGNEIEKIVILEKEK